MKFDLEKAEKHIQDLAKEHEITIAYKRSRRWSVSITDRYVAIRPIKSIVTYIDTLFAMGHILGKWRSKPRLYQTAGAWIWTRENALFWSSRAEEQMERNLLRFWAWAIRHKTAVLPPDDHAYWNLLSPETRKNFKQMLKVKEVMEA